MIKERNYPKVFVAIPTSSKFKGYCMKDFFENVNNFTYPNMEVHVIDNKPDQKLISQIDLSKVVYNVQEYPEGKSIHAVLSDSHNILRSWFLNSDCSWFFHLESDVFPPIDCIERLLMSKHQVIGCTYQINDCDSRQSMIMIQESFGSQMKKSIALKSPHDAVMIDGTIKNVFHCGLGATLIHRSVFHDIKFRYMDSVNMPPDTFFFTDCFLKQIKVYIDTSIICEHRNQSWMEKALNTWKV